MPKLNKEEIKSIKELIKIKTSREVAKLFDVSQNTIIYWTTDREKIKKRNIERYRKKSKKEKKRICQKQREYQKNYHKDKYNNDMIFREKAKKRAREYKRRCN